MIIPNSVITFHFETFSLFQGLRSIKCRNYRNEYKSRVKETLKNFCTLGLNLDCISKKNVLFTNK
jgi:hypothetical protein